MGSIPAGGANAGSAKRQALFALAPPAYEPTPSATAHGWVRIPHPKIGVLAHQAQGVGIFAKGEIPAISLLLTFFVECAILNVLHKSHNISPEWAFLSLVKMHTPFSACSG